MPRLSVVIPAFNAASTIARAVESVLQSRLSWLECLVVDDGSTDGTMDSLSHIDDPRLRMIRIDHSGVAAAANAGTRASDAPYIARMDADDWSHPERFEKQLAVLESNDADVVGGLVRIVDAHGAPVESMRRYESWVNSNIDDADIKAFRFVESPMVNPTVMARREVFELGFREGPFPEDYDLWLRAMRRNYRFLKLPEPVLDWTDGPGRLTRSNPNYSTEAFDRSRRTHLLAGPLMGSKRVNLWGAGQTGKPWLRWLLDEDFEVRRVIEVSRRKIGERIHGVSVISPDDMPPADGTPLVIAVGAEGARELILEHLVKTGHVPGVDAWFVA